MKNNEHCTVSRIETNLETLNSIPQFTEGVANHTERSANSKILLLLLLL